MRYVSLSFLLVSFISLLLGGSAQALTGFDFPGRAAFVVDYDTGTVLYEKNADERIPTASMSKVMTMVVVFDALEQGRLTLDQTVPVSEKAWRMQGSKMFIYVGSQVKVDDLIRGVIVQSGNDATIALAEAVAGSEDLFADLMNRKAKEIGMTGSHFTNASGWPDPNHYSTARDLAMLGRYLIRAYPTYYKYYAETEFEYCPARAGDPCIKQGNRNPLLYRGIGADGIKTGHTEEAGYGLIGSGTDGKRRVVFSISGLDSAPQRADVAATLLTASLRGFENIALKAEAVPLTELKVIDGIDRRVPVSLGADTVLTVPVQGTARLGARALLKDPVLAPIAKGDVMGELIITRDTAEIMRLPLVAHQDVSALNPFARLLAKTLRLLGFG